MVQAFDIRFEFPNLSCGPANTAPISVEHASLLTHADGSAEPDVVWPRTIGRIVEEAGRRADVGELSEEQLYPSDATWAGVYDRMEPTHRTNRKGAPNSRRPLAVARMADVFTRAKRSEVMSRIRGHGNRATEIALSRLFRSNGITGWRRHSTLFGKPDFVFRRERTAIFVDGCFWHCCPKHSNTPVNNREFWVAKLDANVRRDRLVCRTLRAGGWKVLRVWEHELEPRNHGRLLRRIRRALRKRLGDDADLGADDE